ncbi:MAG: 3-hydroxyacyl-ACP dehydratase FabZ [Candidatus Melainabacteria bacterium]|nr:3-hydroxyacyl-ACP dehydratase FabZ [Candidatus Melainabacteria bacterium]
MDIEAIMAKIPHRYPFLLVDRVTHLDPGRFIRGYKLVSMNEPFFQGHFPGRPIMPGVLQLEALAQMGAVLVSDLPEAQNKLSVFAGIDKARFRRIVVPGDRLDLEGELVRLRRSLGRAWFRASVEGDITVEGEMSFAFIDHQTNPATTV